MATQTQSTQMRNGQLVDVLGSRPDGNVTDNTIEQALATEQLHGLMIQLVRQGLDASLKSLQVWADLARQLGAITPGTPAAAALASLAYDLFEKLLMAQRKVVNELADSQQQFAQRFFGTTGDGPTNR